MPTEQYANFPLTTLNGAIDNVVTTITVTSAAGFPTDNQYRIRIDDELMIVTAGAGTTSWTITRGAEGTTAASHNNGAVVRHILTRDGLKRLGTNLHLIDTFANRPAAGLEGRTFQPSNGRSEYRDNGTLWVPSGPKLPFTEPIDGDFAWINQDTATVDTTKGGIALRRPGRSAGASLSIRKKAAPTVPYTITVAFTPIYLPKPFNHCGILFRQDSDGKLHTFDLSINGAGTGWRYESRKWNSPTSFSADYRVLNTQTPGPVVWMRIADDNTNRICSFSYDGQEFVEFHSVARTDFLTATEVGFFIDAENSATPNLDAVMIVHSWIEG